MRTVGQAMVVSLSEFLSLDTEYNQLKCRNIVSVAAHELQQNSSDTETSQRSRTHETSENGSKQQNGTRIPHVENGLQHSSSALFKFPAAIGNCRLAKRMWRRWRRTGGCCLLHRPGSRRAYLGCGNRCYGLPHLLRHHKRNVSSGPVCRNFYHIYSNGAEQRDNVLFRGDGL
jgi:hypothetical protein